MGSGIKEYFSIEELAAAGLGHPARIRVRAKIERWSFQDVSKGRGRPEKHYAIASLPESWRIKLARLNVSREAAPTALLKHASSNLPTNLKVLPGSNADTQHRAELPACLTSDPFPECTSPVFPSSYHELPAHAQKRCDARAEVIAAFDDFQRDSTLSIHDAAYAFIVAHKSRFPEIRLSGPTLLRWLRVKKKSGTAALGGAARSNRKGTGFIESHPEIREWLIAKDIELNGAAKEARVSIEEFLRGARGQFSDAAPSYKQIARFLKEFRAKYAVERSFHSEPDRARGRFMPAFGDASAGVYDFMQRLELDGSPSDCLTLSGRRRIIALTDIFTRMRWAIVAPSESGEWTGRLFAKVFSTVGVPSEIVTDNGSGFVSARIRAMLGDLEVAYRSVQRFRGDLKPFAESAFKYIQQRVAMLPGYAGRNVAMREELRGRLSMPNRMGKTEAEILRVKLTDEELETFLDNYLARVYANSAHSGLSGKTPNQMLAAWVQAGGRARRIKDIRAIYGLLMLTGETRRVVKKGIQIDNAYYQSAAFIPWMNKDVLVGRHHEPGKIVVWSLGERREFVCVAINRELMTPEQQRSVAIEAKQVQRDRMSLFKREIRAIGKANDTPLHESVLEAFDDVSSVEVPSIAFENDATRAALESIEQLEAVNAERVAHYDEAEIVEGTAALRALDAKHQSQISDFEEDQRDWERYQALCGVADLNDDDSDFIQRYEGSPEFRSRMIAFDSPRKVAS